MYYVRSAGILVLQQEGLGHKHDTSIQCWYYGGPAS